MSRRREDLEEAASFVEVAQGVVLALGGSEAGVEESALVRAFVAEIRLEQERVQLERISGLAEEPPGR